MIWILKTVKCYDNLFLYQDKEVNYMWKTSLNQFTKGIHSVFSLYTIFNFITLTIFNNKCQPLLIISIISLDDFVHRGENAAYEGTTHGGGNIMAIHLFPVLLSKNKQNIFTCQHKITICLMNHIISYILLTIVFMDCLLFWKAYIHMIASGQ